eukprot:1652461-Rhodomonas_salina.1
MKKRALPAAEFGSRGDPRMRPGLQQKQDRGPNDPTQKQMRSQVLHSVGGGECVSKWLCPAPVFSEYELTVTPQVDQ